MQYSKNLLGILARVQIGSMAIQASKSSMDGTATPLFSCSTVLDVSILHNLQEFWAHISSEISSAQAWADNVDYDPGLRNRDLGAQLADE